MLNIPEEVKRLLKQDSVRKNFRVHFPNGEYDDITNGNLVAESVVLTESLCSEQNIKFGLCEASQLEFETIGVGNVKGCEIQAFIEIDISSLPSDIIATIDYMYLNDGTIAYQIPYGVFTVDSCKRQNDMSKRKIIAYSKNILDKIELSSIEKEKERIAISTKSDYTVDLLKTLYSNLNNVDSSMYTEIAYEFEIDEHLIVSISSLIETYRTVVYKGVKIPIFAEQDDEHKLFKVELDKVENYKEIVLEIQDTLSSYELIMDAFNLCNVCYVIYDMDGFSSGLTYIPTKGNLIYPYIPGIGTTTIEYGYIYVPLEISVVERNLTDSSYKKVLNEWTLATNCSISELTPTELFANKTITLKRTKTTDGKYIVAEPLDLRAILESWVELQGKFVYNSRYGGVSLISIKEKFGLYPSEDLYPSEELYPREPDDIVSTSLYSNVWYEEYTVQKYGRLLIPYINEENETEEFLYVFNEDNKNTYFFSENYLLSLYSFTQDEIKEIIDTYFLPHIEYITYVPAEITMRGLPYLEVGDVVSVLTNSGYSFETIVWQRKLKGIQALTDSVTATGDEVNEKVSESVTII